MEAKKALELLVRAKNSYAKLRTVDAIGAIIMVIKGMGNSHYPTELTSNLRELMLLVGPDPIVVGILGKPVIFKAGEEQNMLVPLARVYKIASEEKKEDFSAALERKVKLDRAYNEGLRQLKNNNIQEAEEYFTEALTHYKDEHSLFLLIGEAFMAIEAPRRAFPYLSKGLMADPHNARLKDIYDKCAILKERKR